MSVYIEYNTISATKAEVTLRHYMPELLTDDQKEAGLLVDDVPDEPQVEDGKISVLYVNPQNKTMWWETKDKPLTPEEQKVKDLETRLQATEDAVLQLILSQP